MSVSITIGLNLTGPIAAPHLASAGQLTGSPERLLQYLSCLKQSDPIYPFIGSWQARSNLSR